MTRLVTERLTLRQWKDSDRDPWAAMNADEEVLRFFPSTKTREESDAAVDRFIHHLSTYGWGLWAAELTETGEFMGFIGLWPMPIGFPAADLTEIGWRLDKRFWGKGYAPEGARAVLHHAFTVLGKPELVSMTTVTNAPSRRVMTKIGMTHSPDDDFVNPTYEPGHWQGPHVLHRITAEQYFKTTVK
ncbi:GNAT family N-acetyltransferase [Kineosporia sp. NBRC 101731]|uniref:GNAT family N-acetyltransferase n=1 Tax=Kineosporia sp. NBRC 101731 TaxID=3032199 RepID=UPI00255326CF|nr:GNAT family N-acetyltransferase [Kineosporia sp. NBRC 101731]